MEEKTESKAKPTAYKVIPFRFVVKHDCPDEKIKKSGSEWSMTCPFCGKKGKFYFDDQYGHCFTENTGYNPVTFHAAMTGLDNKAAYADLVRLYEGMPSDVRTKYYQPKENKAELEPAPLSLRSLAYQAFVSEGSLSEKHRENLHARGLTDEDITRLQLTSVPLSGLKQRANFMIMMDKYLHEDGHNYQIPGVIGFNGDAAWLKRGSGILIPIVWHDGSISGFQVRNDVTSLEAHAEDAEKARQEKAIALVNDKYAKGIQPTQAEIDAMKPVEVQSRPRYTYYSSAGYKGGVGCSGIENIHFVGPDFKLDPYEPKSSPVVNITEGCLKADVASALSKRDFIGLLGVGMQKRMPEVIDWCKKYGTRQFNMCFDMDMFSNPNVMDALCLLGEKLTDGGYPILLTDADMRKAQIRTITAAMNRKKLEDLCRANELTLTLAETDDRSIAKRYVKVLCTAIGKKLDHSAPKVKQLMDYMNRTFHLSEADSAIAESFTNKLVELFQAADKPYRIVSAEELKNAPYKTRITTWDPTYKGIDDYLLHLKKTKTGK